MTRTRIVHLQSNTMLFGVELVLVWRKSFNRVDGDVPTAISNKSQVTRTEKVEIVELAAVVGPVVLVHTYL
jgi:hypothetical protein